MCHMTLSIMLMLCRPIFVQWLAGSLLSVLLTCLYSYAVAYLLSDLCGSAGGDVKTL